MFVVGRAVHGFAVDEGLRRNGEPSKVELGGLEGCHCF